jgi:hypothetical protein
MGHIKGQQSKNDAVEAAAKVVAVLRGPVPGNSQAANLAYQPGSVAYSLQHALSWTAALRDKTASVRRRWCIVSAELLVSCLKRDFQIAHPTQSHEELVAIVAAALFTSPARPNSSWVGRQPWAHKIAGDLADRLAPDPTVFRPKERCSVRRNNDAPIGK